MGRSLSPEIDELTKRKGEEGDLPNEDELEEQHLVRTRVSSQMVICQDKRRKGRNGAAHEGYKLEPKS